MPPHLQKNGGKSRKEEGGQKARCELTDLPAPTMLMMPAWMVSSCFFFSASAEMMVTFTAPLDACISSAVVVVEESCCGNTGLLELWESAGVGGE